MKSWIDKINAYDPPAFRMGVLIGSVTTGLILGVSEYLIFFYR